MIARLKDTAPRCRRRLAESLFLVLLMVGTIAPVSHAQNTDRLQTEIEATDRILMRAREIVLEHGNPRAVQELEFALRLQENARLSAQESALGPQAMLRSLQLTRQARNLAQRAINIAAQQAQLEQRAMQAMRELERVLEGAIDRLGDAPSERMQRLLNLADRRLEQAREAFHTHRFEEALNMAQEVRRLLENLSDRTSNRDLDRMFEATRRLLERAEEEVGDKENADVFLKRARQMVERAEESQAAGHAEAANRQLRQAREMILRVMRDNQSPPDVARVDRILQETTNYVEDMASRVRESESPEAITLMENALRHMQRAQDLRAENKLRQSLAEARVARNLARRAAQLAGINEL